MTRQAFLTNWFRDHGGKSGKEKIVSISSHEFKKIGKMLKELEYVKVPVEVGTEAIHAK